MANEEKKSGKKSVVFLIIIGLILAVAGGVLTYLTSPKYVATTAIKQVQDAMTSLVNQRTETGLEDNYKTTGTIDFNLTSDYFASLSTLDPEYATISNLLRNLTATENNITLVQDKDNKRLFVNYDSKLNGQNLINAKYLVEDATEYYHLEGVTPSYINNGNNNYFESLNSATTTNENITYIIEKVAESAINNLKDEYLSTKYEDNYKVIMITLSNKQKAEYINNILQDLKQDSKANQILTGYNSEFSSLKVSEKDLEGTDNLDIYIYLDQLTTQVKRYEIYPSDGEEIVYSKEDGQDVLSFVSGDEKSGQDVEKINFTITKSGEKTDVAITDQDNTSLGSISITKTSTSYDIIMNFTSGTTVINLGYNSQLTNLEKASSYNKNTTLTINISADATTIIDGTITYNTTTTSDTSITEDISTSQLASTLTEEQNALIEQQLTNMMTTLIS